MQTYVIMATMVELMRNDVAPVVNWLEQNIQNVFILDRDPCCGKS